MLDFYSKSKSEIQGIVYTLSLFYLSGSPVAMLGLGAPWAIDQRLLLDDGQYFFLFYQKVAFRLLYSIPAISG